MSQNTGIEWATSTGNPWIGCTMVSPGCVNCYAATLDDQRFSKTMGGGTADRPESHWGKGAPRVRTKAFWKDALKWNKQAGPERPRIFPSLCDWLDEEAPISWFLDFLRLINATPNLDWLLLTKRPAGIRGQIYCDYVSEYGLPNNVWIGVSVEDQKRAEERIPKLLEIPAKIRFLSVEPLLEEIYLGNLWPVSSSDEGTGRFDTRNLSWVIIGGESGPNRRDCGVESISNVASYCSKVIGVSTFVKQDCALKPGQQNRLPDDIWKLKQFPCSTSPG